MIALALAVMIAAPDLAPAETIALAEASRRGRLIYEHDQAAWHTTDAMLKAVPDPRVAGITGYFVEPGVDTLTVTFYGSAGGTSVPIYRADYARGRVVNGQLIPGSERRAVTPSQARMIEAIAAAGKAKLHRCSLQSMNSIIYWTGTPNTPLNVYMMTPQPAVGSYALGGHNLVEVAPGGKVVGTRAFTKSCLTMNTAAPAGGTPAAMVISHLLGPTPTEIHVFTSLASRRPVYVVVRDGRLWKVDGTDIELVDRSPDRRMPAKAQ